MELGMDDQTPGTTVWWSQYSEGDIRCILPDTHVACFINERFIECSPRLYVDAQ